MTTDPVNEHQRGGGGAGRWVFWGFVLVAAFFLISEHRAHVLEYLPVLLLLGCAAMHLFHGHGSHKGHGGHAGKESDEPKR
jgi:hypothetical protein